MIWPKEQMNSLLHFSSSLEQMSGQSDKTQPGEDVNNTILLSN